jgi:FtsP/CotA-like multicopper oxidase with cupredoxin domain
MQSDATGRYVTMFLVGALAILLLPIAAVGIVSATKDSPATTSTTSTTTANISLSEFAIKGDLTVPAGKVDLAIKNTGTQTHTLALDGGPATKEIAAGAGATLSLGELEAGTYTLRCTVPGHAEAGMVATLTVTGGSGMAMGGSGTTGSGGSGTTGDTPDYAAMDKAMEDSIAKFPAPTKGKGNVPLVPTILPDGTKELDLTVSIIDWEVEPGKTVKAWAYNGMVPGPEIRLNVGDKVKAVIKNDLPAGTDVHWHGINTPFAMDGVAPLTQKLIEPGQTFTYEFVADKQEVGMYHAHHMGNLEVPNGLFGAFIVGSVPLPLGRTISGVTIPKDVKPVQDLPMVLNDAGVIGLTINGKSFPATDPIQVAKGDWIEVSYFNEGFQAHPMHLHKFPQLVLAKDGIPLDNPYWADTILVGPGERYTVLIHADDVGAFVWHCHILNHVERDTGMFGMVTALIVK